MSLKELLAARLDFVTTARKVLEKAAAEKRNLSSEEEQEYDRLDKEIDAQSTAIDKLNADAARRAKLDQHTAALDKLQTRIVTSDAIDGAREILKLDLGLGQFLSISPDSPAYARGQAQYRTDFMSYLATGRASLGLQTNVNTQGGYLTPLSMMAKLIRFLNNNVYMRGLATVLPPMPDSQGIGVPSLDTDPNDATWSSEVPAANIPEDTAMALGKREFIPHLLVKLLKLSRKLLAASILDIEDLVVERMGYKFEIAEEKAYMLGTGAQQPLGVFVASNNGIPTSQDFTASGTTSFTPDNLVDLFFGLKEAYQKRATFIFNRTVVALIRKFKTGAGQYIWEAGLAGGAGNTILDRPYVMSEYAPNTMTTGKYVGIVGDFKTGYWIGDGINLEIQNLNELFALTNQVGLLGRKETDGAPVLPECFQRLKLA